MSTKSKRSDKAIGQKQIAHSLSLLEKIVAPFADVEPLTGTDRRRLTKMQRGAHQVIPTIANLARKFAIAAPGLSVDDMLSAMDHAAEIEPLLNAVAAFHQTLKDEYLASTGKAWKTATVTYRMLRTAGEGNRRVADELEQVQKWFRRRPRAANAAVDGNGQATPKKSRTKKPAATTAANGDASTDAKPASAIETPVATAPAANGTTSGAAHAASPNAQA